MRRIDEDKTVVAQLYLKDWSMKNEILRKAQMYEQHTIVMHRSKSNNNDINNLDINHNIQLITPKALHGSATQSTLLKMRNCNRSLCDIQQNTSNNPLVTLKVKNKINKRNKKILKLRKYKEILDENRIPPMISIDKL